MINYLKSELYRLVRNPSLYLFLSVCILAPVFMVLLTVSIGGERYANTEFVFKAASSSWSLVFYVVPVIVGMVMADDFTDGTFKNTIAYGTSRNTVFYGKWLMAVLVMAVSWTATYTALSSSAFLLLPNNGTSYFMDFTLSTAGVLPLILAALTVSHCLFYLTGKTMAHLVSYAVIMVAVPELYYRVGNGVPALLDVVERIPLFPYAAANDMDWFKPNGWVLCWTFGAAYTLLAFLSLSRRVARKEFK